MFLFGKKKAKEPRFAEFRHFAYMQGTLGMTWRSFVQLCKSIAGSSLRDDLVPFSTALSSWGFSPTLEGETRARRVMLCMIVFFFVMSCYGVVTTVSCLVHGSYSPRLFSYLLLTAVSLVCGYITIWRYDVISKRRYIPLRKWAFHANPWAVGMVLLMAAMGGTDVMQGIASVASGIPDISLPTGVAIDKAGDLSASIFASILGEPWTRITGIGPFAGGPVKYMGLMLATLEVLNTAALVYVSAFIFYLWGVFAATSAYSGKILGDYSSFWVPMRHAFSFSFTAPVMSGLSLLQIVIIAAIAYGINFANAVFDGSSKYIADHGNVGLITTVPPVLENEAMDAARMFFQAAVAQEISKRKNGEWVPDIVQYPVPKQAGPVLGVLGRGFEKELSAAGVVNVGSTPIIAGGVDEGFIIQRNPETMEVVLTPLGPQGFTFGSMGSVTIPLPSTSLAPASGQMWQNTRVQTFLKLFQSMQSAARYYLASREYKTDGEASLPNLQATLGEYRSGLIAAMQAYGGEVLSQTSVQKIIKDSLDPTDEQGNTSNGWATAGLYTFSIAAMQKQLDDLMFAPVTVVQPGGNFNLNEEGKSGGVLSSMWAWIKSGLGLETKEATLLADSGQYFDEEIAKRTRYSTKAAEFNPGRLISSTVSMLIPARTDNTSGILENTIRSLTEADPIVVLTNMGSRLYGVGLTWMGLALTTSVADAAAGFLDQVPFFGSGIGVARAIFNFPALMTLAGFMVVIGFLLAYLVPAIPAVFWIRALLSWMYLVIESMVAAPFWGVAHAMPEGQGFAGERAKRGYMLFIDIIIRPPLLVIGAVFSIVLIQVWGIFLNKILSIWMNTLGQTQGFGVIGEMVYSFVVIYIIYTSCYTIFVKGVNHLPVYVARWIGGGGVTLGEEEEAQTTSRTIGGVILHSGSRGVNEAGGAGRVLPGHDAVRGLRNKGGNSLENPDAGGGSGIGASANAQSAPKESGGSGANAQTAEMPAPAPSGDSKPVDDGNKNM